MTAFFFVGGTVSLPIVVDIIQICLNNMSYFSFLLSLQVLLIFVSPPVMLCGSHDALRLTGFCGVVIGAVLALF